MNKKTLILLICISIAVSPVFSDDSVISNENSSDYVSESIELLEKNIQSLEETGKGTYDDGTEYAVYKIGENIKVTVSIDTNDTRYIVGNVNSPEIMQRIITLFAAIFSEPIPYLNSSIKDYKAAFYDSGDFYISGDLPGYIGTFTILGSQLFVEEVRAREKLIIQRQWCTPEYYDQCVQELGSGWGFLASWDPEPQSMLDNYGFMVYTVKSGDYLAKIAREYYGNEHLWGLIYELNKKTFPVQNQPNLILPEMQLIMPSIEFINSLTNSVQNN